MLDLRPHCDCDRGFQFAGFNPGCWVRRISDADMPERCLAHEQLFGSAVAMMALTASLSFQMRLRI